MTTTTLEVPDLQRRREEANNARRGMALSPREVEVLAQLSQGMSYDDIGLELNITLDTVKSHLKRIFVKLGARNGAHAVGLGYELGVLRGGGARDRDR